MGKVQNQFGIKIDEPQWVEIPRDDSVGQYIDAIKSDIDP